MPANAGNRLSLWSSTNNKIFSYSINQSIKQAINPSIHQESRIIDLSYPFHSLAIFLKTPVLFYVFTNCSAETVWFHYSWASWKVLVYFLFLCYCLARDFSLIFVVRSLLYKITSNISVGLIILMRMKNQEILHWTFLCVSGIGLFHGKVRNINWRKLHAQAGANQRINRKVSCFNLQVVPQVLELFKIEPQMQTISILQGKVLEFRNQIDLKVCTLTLYDGYRLLEKITLWPGTTRKKLNKFLKTSAI